MIKQEWSRLLSNKVLIVVLIAIIAIPAIYTTLFLGSMWDPYGQLDQLPVAVVNNDKSVSFNDKKLSIGQQLVDSLNENDSLQFNFVDEKTAQKGLQNGTFYMVITIPEDFSKNASTLMNDAPQKMNLLYETNPGTNYIASKLSETALTKIKNEVASEVTETYAQTMFGQLANVGNGMQNAVNGVQKLSDGEKELFDGNTKITDNLNKLADSTLTFQDGSEKLNVGLSQYTQGVTKLNDGAKQLHDGVNSLSTKVSDGTSQLINGASDLEQGISDYTNGVSTAAAGASKLDKKSSELTGGANSLYSGTQQLKNGSSSVLAGLNQISFEIGNNLNYENQNQLNQVQTGLSTLNSGIDQLNTAIQDIEIPDVSLAIASFTAPIQAIGADAQDASINIQNMETYLTQLAAAYPQITQDSNFDKLIKEMQNAGTDMADMHTKFNSVQQAVSNLPDTSALSDTIQSLKTNLNNLASGAQLVLPASQQTITELSSGLINIKTTLDKTGTDQTDMGLIQGMQGIDNGLSDILSGTKTLQNGMSAYNEGVSQVDTGLSIIDSNSNSLKSGASLLNSGVQQLTDGLDSGVQQLKDGTSSMYQGTNELITSNNSLLDGSMHLTDGALQLSDGASQLAKGSSDLGSGLSEVIQGADSLQNGITDGAQEINNMNTNDKTTDMFAKPVEATETKITEVKDNGHAMAAYMMSVALWVACIAFSIMYPLTEYSGKLKSGFSWWFSKASIIYPIAIIMALVMIGALHCINNFTPAEWGNTILIACITALAFISIMYFFNVLLGKVGSFIMLIFMVVQLAGSAGTYPIELSGSFVSKIHKWLPFSYTVDAFRSTIAGGSNITHAILVLTALTLIFTTLTILIFQVRTKRIQKEKPYVYEYLEMNGLA